jgi:hypothetical protein
MGYIALSIVMALFIVMGYSSALQRTGADPSVRFRRVGTLVAGLIAWGLYVLLLDRSGVLRTFALPPRFPILLIFPAFMIGAIILYRSRNSPVLAALPLGWPIYYQVCRVGIELLFVASVASGALHKEVTIEGYNPDLFFGLSAPLIAFTVFNRGVLSTRVALLWNYLGLAVIGWIIVLFFTTLYWPALWGSPAPLLAPDRIALPFLLVPAFLMPSAVFMHILSILHLRHRRSG